MQDAQSKCDDGHCNFYHVGMNVYLLCVTACGRERYLKTWVPPVPEVSQLSDADITQFVTGMTTVTSLAMFNKAGSTEPAAAMQFLAMLRPEIIVPPILDVYVPEL